jgi:hypothetical protein
MAKMQRVVQSRVQQKRQAEAGGRQNEDDGRESRSDGRWRELVGSSWPLEVGIPQDRSCRGSFVLGQAQAVRMTKTGGARMVKVSAKKFEPFNMDTVSTVEADLMYSAGAAARSSRRSSLRTDGEASSRASTPDIRASKEMYSAIRSEQLVGQFSGQNERFRGLVRRLETNAHKPSYNIGNTLAPELSRVTPSPAAAPEQHFEVFAEDDQWAARETHFYPEYRCFNSAQRRVPVDDRSTLTLNSKVPANPISRPGSSGCPSLISDDGREPLELLGEMAEDNSRVLYTQGSSVLSAWAKEEESSRSSMGLTKQLHPRQQRRGRGRRSSLPRRYR